MGLPIINRFHNAAEFVRRLIERMASPQNADTVELKVNPLSLQENEIFGVIGEEGFQKVVARFYRKVPNDDILGPMYPPQDMDGAEKRLRGFLIYRLGGPDTYLTERGHPRLRMRHAPFAVDKQARDRWMQLMTEAIDESQIPDSAAAAMKTFFEGVATFLLNR